MVKFLRVNWSIECQENPFKEKLPYTASLSTEEVIILTRHVWILKAKVIFECSALTH